MKQIRFNFASLPLPVASSVPKAPPQLIRHAVHFSSETDLWATPQLFFDQWNAVYRFELDVCALPSNAKCARYFTPEEDGLKQRWTGVCWMNPPYGREIGHWVKKAYQSAQEGATVVCLLPSRTDTRWWHSYVVQATEVHFIQGRLKFGDSKNSAPFPSAVVVFRPSATCSPQGFPQKNKLYIGMQRRGSYYPRSESPVDNLLSACAFFAFSLNKSLDSGRKTG